MKKHILISFFLIISLIIIILSCDIILIDPSNIGSSDDNNESAANYSYGYGTFGNPANHLKKNNGDLILSGLDFIYDQTLVNIYDTNNAGGFNSGKYFRIIEDGINVINGSGLNLEPYAKDLSSTIYPPPANQVYIDPVNGAFVLPRPNYWSRCESLSDLSDDAEINSECWYDDENGSGDIYVNTGKFGNMLRFDVNKDKYYKVHMNKYNNKGTISLWFELEDANDRRPALVITAGNLSIVLQNNGSGNYYHTIKLVGSSTELSSSTVEINELKHLYVVWDSSKGLGNNTKTVRVFINNQEIMYMASSFDPFYFGDVGIDFANFSGADYISWIDVDNIKFWDEVVSEDPSFEYNNGDGREDALHSIYGDSNGYKPGSVKVGYYK